MVKCSVVIWCKVHVFCKIAVCAVVFLFVFFDVVKCNQQILKRVFEGSSGSFVQSDAGIPSSLLSM